MERTIQTLEDMIRACVVDFKRIWDEYFPLVVFSYNNSYHSTISMAPFEALSGRRCSSPIGWFEVGDSSLFGSEMIYKSLDKVHITRNRLKTSYSWQKSYADNKRRELVFKEGHKV